jgi:hypothetical protein
MRAYAALLTCEPPGLTVGIPSARPSYTSRSLSFSECDPGARIIDSLMVFAFYSPFYPMILTSQEAIYYHAGYTLGSRELALPCPTLAILYR